MKKFAVKVESFKVDKNLGYVIQQTTKDSTQEILNYFYSIGHFPHAVMGDDSRRLLLRPVTYEISNLQGGESSKLEVRKDFNPLALFEPNLKTGVDGTVSVKVKLPDNLSTYRLTAIALSGVSLGFNENQFRVSNPVNVRSALPRRFRNRDSAAAGLVLTNTTDGKQKLTVSVESDILGIAGKSTKTVVLEAKSSTELPFIMEALREGNGTLRFTIRGDVLNEVLEEKIVVERPLIIESFTSVGAVSGEGVVESLIIPEDTGQGFGNLALRIDASLRPYVEASIQRLDSLTYPSMNERLYALMASVVTGAEIQDAIRSFE